MLTQTASLVFVMIRHLYTEKRCDDYPDPSEKWGLISVPPGPTSMPDVNEHIIVDGVLLYSDS